MTVQVQCHNENQSPVKNENLYLQHLHITYTLNSANSKNIIIGLNKPIRKLLADCNN